MKRFLRAILALCMCFTIVLSCAIPHAQALDPITGAVLYNIAGNIGVSTALRAIGVGPGNSPQDFNDLVNRIVNSDLSYNVSEILMAVSSGDSRGFFQKSFLQGILDFMLDTGVLKDNSVPLINNVDFTVGSYSYSVSTSPIGNGPGSAYFVVGTGSYYNSGSYHDVYNAYLLSSADMSFRLYINGSLIQSGTLTSSKYTKGYAFQISYSSASDPVSSGLPVIDVGQHTSYNYFVNALLAAVVGTSGVSVSTDQDLFLDAVAPTVDSDLYDSWVANGGTYDGGDYIPVSIPSLDASAISSQTQAQAQAGTIPDAVVEEIIAGSEAVPDTDTGTLAGVIDAIQALPQTLADLFTGIKDAVLSIPQAIADVFSPPAVSESYQISLSSFFPFCIPFDLYNLLDALAAAPEAPVFNGVIPVPTFGQTYEIEVDLTPWDNVAALFRTLQLGLFIVGLALVTRERFLRS